MKGRNFNKFLISILKHADETSHFCDSDRESLTIKKLIEVREHIYVFCDEVVNILNCWATSLIKLRSKLLESIVEILRDYAQKSTKGRHLRAQNEIESYRMMILCGIYDIGKFRTLIKKDVEDTSLPNKVFYCLLNKVFDFARKEKVSIQSVLMNSNKRDILKYDANAATKRYNNDSTEWMNAINDDYNHVEMMDYSKKEQDLKKDDNKNDKISIPPRPPNNPNGIRPPRGRGRGRYRNRPRGGRGRHQRGWNGEQADRLAMGRNYLQSISSELKPELAAKTTQLCGYFHAPGVNCQSQVDGENKCSNRSGKKFSHNCVCGNKHRLFTCRTIWK